MIHSGGGGCAFILFGRPPLKPRRSDGCHLFRLPQVGILLA